MKKFVSSVTFAVLLCLPVVGVAQGKTNETYKHASEYMVAILDQTLRVSTGDDVTLGKTGTDAKLGPGGQGIHLLHTEAGDYRVEAPVNKGMTFMSAFAAGMNNRPQDARTFHNKWFLDNVQADTKVLFAAECVKPNKKHPNDAVRCTFWFPDPDSASHEYQTIGDFTPYTAGDGSNTQKTANTLCGTGKLRPEVEAELCTTASAGPAPIPAPLAPKSGAPSSVPDPEPDNPGPASIMGAAQ